MDYYFVAKTKEEGFIGQLTLEEIASRFRARELPGDYVAAKAGLLSYRQLMKSGGAAWVTVTDLVVNTPLRNTETASDLSGISFASPVTSPKTNLSKRNLNPSVQEIRQHLEQKSTAALREIYLSQNEHRWSDEAVVAIRELLIERGAFTVDLPRHDQAPITRQEPKALLLPNQPTVLDRERSSTPANSLKVTGETLPMIHAVARDGAIQSAAGSLALWGAINLGAWLLLGGENREFLAKLTNPTGGIYLLLYGGLVLGVVMLAFAALGVTTRFSGTIFLDGLSLIGVGVWNLTHDFIAISALRPYGYTTVGTPGGMWAMLGVCQVVWGFRQFSTFGRMSSWSIAELTPNDLAVFSKDLQSFVQLNHNPQAGIVRGSITSKGPLGLDLFSRTTEYTGTLLADSAIMVSTKLDDCLTISKPDAENAQYGPDGIMAVLVEGFQKKITLNPLSVLAFKEWTGRKIEVSDIQLAAKKRTLTVPNIRPYLVGDDPQLRAVSVAALPSVSDSESLNLPSSFLNDPDPGVRASAVLACKQLKVEAVQSKVIDLLADEHGQVRFAAAQYFSALPQSSTRALLERALSSETNEDVKREMKRALRAIKK